MSIVKSLKMKVWTGIVNKLRSTSSSEKIEVSSFAELTRQDGGYETLCSCVCVRGGKLFWMKLCMKYAAYMFST